MSSPFDIYKSKNNEVFLMTEILNIPMYLVVWFRVQSLILDLDSWFCACYILFWINKEINFFYGIKANSDGSASSMYDHGLTYTIQ